MHDLRLAFYVFGVIFVAELPDKTALAALVLATRHRALTVFFGAALALTIQSAVAVAAGSLLSLLPQRVVHIGAGVVFFASALAMLLRKDEAPPGRDATADGRAARNAPGFWRASATVFGVVFLAEWGDLTQFATAAFAAHERAPWIIFGSATLALWAVTAIAVAVGNRAAKFLNPVVTKRVAAGLFAVVGVALVAGWL